MSGGASVQTRDGVTQGAASIMKSASDAPGSVGWRAEYSEGDVRRGAASGVYMGSKAIVQGYASAQEDYAYGNVNVTGAVVAAGGGVFVGRPIYDGFAIVDAGAPDIDVYANNRLVGRTNRGGKISRPEPSRLPEKPHPHRFAGPADQRHHPDHGKAGRGGAGERRVDQFRGRHGDERGARHFQAGTTVRSFRPEPPRGSKAAPRMHRSSSSAMTARSISTN